MTSDSPHLRMGVLGVVAISLFAALFSRLWFLQVMSAPTFAVAAQTNRERVVAIPPVRGRILDSQGRVLADNRLSDVVTVDRKEVANEHQRDILLAKLATVLNVPVDSLHARVDDKKYSPLLPIPLAEDVPEATVTRIAEQQDDFPGVEAKEVALRVYPFGSRAAHVLGYVGAINDTEYASLKGDGYTLEDQVGKDGVEKIFEKDLRGTPGSITLEVDSAGRVLRELSRTDAIPGRDVQLTLDLSVQALAEDALAKALLNARTHTPKDNPNHFAAPAGSVVVLDPTNGSIVAMASYPTFDPREFVGGIDSDRYKSLLDPANNYPLTDRAIAGQYAPGSTFKMITATAGLAAGVISSGTRFLDAGRYTVPDCKGEKCTFSNAGGEQNGWVNMPTALAESSDVYFYSIGADLWRFRDQYNLAIQDTATAYGFGAETGVPLPGEQEGRVPTPEQKQAAHDENPTAFPFGQWFTGDNVNLAVGQGEMLSTPLQLANAYAAFANGGTVFSPNIASRILDPTTGDDTVPRVDREMGPRVLRTIPLTSAVRDPILAGLVGAVSSPQGTAAPAFSGFPLSHYPIAGKTGTAQTAGKQAQFDTSLFVGFGPVGSPKYVVAAVLEQSGFGAEAAAPVVRRMFESLGGFTPLPEVQPAPPIGVVAPLVVSGLVDDPAAGSAVD
jgi:penicillin-binding protein 2